MLVQVTSFLGTPKFAAPERFVAGAHIDLTQADIFSLGVTLWAIWTRLEPHAAASVDDVVMRMKAVASSPQADLTEACRACFISLCFLGEKKGVLSSFVSHLSWPGNAAGWSRFNGLDHPPHFPPLFPDIARTLSWEADRTATTSSCCRRRRGL